MLGPGRLEERAMYLEVEEAAVALDLRGMTGLPETIAALEPALGAALDAMRSLEAGAIANPDEGRRVGHYWLRAPELAPDAESREAIVQAQDAVRRFAAGLDARFRDVLHIGIGGSALGPQLVTAALAGLDAPRRIHYLDNTDPHGFHDTLAGLDLAGTLVVVVSKSGGTVETRNGLQAARAAFDAAGVPFASHAVAVTGEGSALDREAVEGGWLARFPMWDWVGGRTSVTSAVGLLPMALLGVDTEAFLAGAAAMDRAGRAGTPATNPAALLAAAWHHATGGLAHRAMVVLPYRDRLELLSRYLQQLVMESLGKARDLDGHLVHQGLTVYGNKGATDQHAYVQQLREGPDDCFVTFVDVLDPGPGDLEVEPGTTAADTLSGFLAGTRRALGEAGRLNLTLTLDRLDPRTLGAVVALYERATGIYAALVGVNAYHQPGVEAGKRAAAALVSLQGRLLDHLRGGAGGTAAELAGVLGADPPDVFHILRHLAATGRATATGRGLDRRFSAR
ncbi:MAG: glucose-6-phosphate isomerase [Deltaproteobacteria bacterium]|nr:glucose-6-phosphate isomerase [Deltaproteobacteria bacterium]MCB9785385.1 glucose-6-phosphate isomerase [Deltaproteobacteria bacterium]